MSPLVAKYLSSHTPHLSVSLTRKAISSADKANIFSFLLSHHSLRKVKSIAGLGKSTVGRIYQELEMDKGNHKGDNPFILSPTDQRRARQCFPGHKLHRCHQYQLSNPHICTLPQKSLSPICKDIQSIAHFMNHLIHTVSVIIS